MAAGTSVLSYASTSNMQIRLGIEDDDLASVHLPQKVVITPIYNSHISFIGYISNITDQINVQSGLVDVLVPLEHASGLIPGSMVEGIIYLTKEAFYLSVPRSAVLFDNKKPYVFINNKGLALKKWIILGEEDGNNVAVLKGISVNDQVVLEGNYELEDEMKLDINKES